MIEIPIKNRQRYLSLGYINKYFYCTHSQDLLMLKSILSDKKHKINSFVILTCQDCRFQRQEKLNMASNHRDMVFSLWQYLSNSIEAKLVVGKNALRHMFACS